MDMKFGEFLKKKRIEQKESQFEFAMDLGIHPFTISRWERFVSSPPIDYATEIVESLGGTVQIFEGNNTDGC